MVKNLVPFREAGYTGFFSMVTQCDNNIKVSAFELMQGFGMLVGNVDPDILHHRNRIRTYPTTCNTGTIGLISFAIEMTHQPFGHLRPDRVVAAEKNDAFFIVSYRFHDNPFFRPILSRSVHR